MSRTSKCAPAVLAIATLLALSGVAQAQTGQVVGRVLDSRTSEPLANAQIFTLDGSVGMLTAADGRYALLGLPAGRHDLQVRLLGFADKVVSQVEVLPGSTVSLEVRLEPRAVEVEGVVVTSTARRGSTTSVLSTRRAAAVVSDGISAEQMSRASDGNAASALKRVPGLSIVDGRYAHVRGLGQRYVSTTLNGAPLASPVPDSKVIPLDVMPTGLLQSVVTSKSYSPDQPGDFAGGLVQLNTRDFPANRVVNIGLSGTWNSVATFRNGLGYESGSLDLLGFDDGSRGLPGLIPRNVPVSPSEFTGQELQAMGRAFQGDWGPTPRTLPADHGLSLTYGEAIDLDDARRAGFVLALNYSSSHDVKSDLVERVFSTSGQRDPEVDYTGEVAQRSVALGGLLNVTYQPRPGDEIRFATIYNRLTDDATRLLTGFNLDSNTKQWNSRLQYVGQSLINSQLSGEHTLDFLGEAVFEWRGGYTRAARYEPGTREVLYRQFGGEFYFDDFIQSGSVFHQDLADQGWNGEGKLEIPFTLADRPSSIAAGVSVERKNRDAYTRRFRFRPQVGGIVSDSVRTLAPNELFGGSYITPDGFELREATFRADNYDAEERVDAAFLLVDMEPLEGVRVQGGARVERLSQSVTPRDLWATGLPALTGAELGATDVLPAVNVTLAVTEAMNVRGSASRTLARPQLRELAPFSFADYAGGHLVIGNPELDRSRISNFDLRWEWFAGPAAVAAVSGFYKRFDDPIEVAVLPSTEPLKTWVNADGADNYGVEIELRTGLAFLHEGLTPFSFNGNVTLVHSEVRTGSAIGVYLPGIGPTQLAAVPKRRGLQGQSPYVANLSLSWEPAGGPSATVLFNRAGRRIDAVGGQATPDVFEEARTQLDASLTWPIGKGWDAQLSAERLLGNRVEFTQGGGTLRSYDRGRSVSLSLSWGAGG